MASTDRALGRVSTWSTVALLIGVLAVSFLPARDEGRAPTARTRQAAKAPPLAAPPATVPAPTKDSSPASAPSAAPDKPADQPAAAASEATPDKPPEEVWTEAQIADGLRACVKELAPVAAEVSLEEPMKKGPCGTPAPVRLHSVGTSSKVTFDPAPQMNCRLAAGLASWVESVLQPAAREVLGSRITRIIGSSSYVCRHMYSNPTLPLSEHATGNAIDIAGFITADGRTLRVSEGWGPTERDIAAAKRKLEEAARAKAAKAADSKKDAKAKDAEKVDGKSGAEDDSQGGGKGDHEEDKKAGVGKSAGASKPEPATVHKAGFKPAKDAAKPVPAAAALTAAKTVEAAFLKRLHRGACTVFGTVLGPEANEAHRDHFHFDMKERKWRAVCH